jgi:coenzyme PQQ synthesis protein D (PqqD)
MMQNHPKRVEGLDISPVDDGFVIYEEEKERVHYLNYTAKIVLLLCNGANSATDIAGLLKEHFQLHEPPLSDVESILESFLEEGLIT